ncbi:MULTISPECIES: MmcQ/YjbR family DNA-binding protein [Carnobacterium]|uniref:MmcQ/YjbR family DNA-binding protein n=1 Tax=Carnobacterium TaxID=2747 RepID=UPI0028925DAC|nr:MULTISPECIES: MmcQ/YjbR family DNA-binding protein [Carnobacterium]MDT1939662.1 MmcQ/YjbR family DNA-binding protein [Carnobacterium divergens]MDT1942100.1 MmcQ/YjbR family DNA-binding protein [Carnobacterium divergens]MDT1947898.1 MmcQ/YjbR family DNA-binding protein [Carnobacterium divergens]MDT1950386.1 MmcQ/YjbR family DNA-binding protein [Carnobacterium divergens]MDT1955564.1 MmcQ/YjbR family DNA-binding protein [Carnobacterium divergens]
MSIASRQALLIAEGKKLAGAKVALKEEWGSMVFTVGDKLFALMGENKDGKEIITMKGLPEDNERIREDYQSVTYGYYMNKTHWISIDLATTELEDGHLLELLKKSYRLIVEKLPKKIQQELQDSTNVN